MFEKILVAVDLAHADKSSSIIARAKKLADINEGQLTLLNVVIEIPPYVSFELPAGIQEKSISDAKVSLTKLAEESELPPSTTIEVKKGNPANEILKLAKEINADLILVVSHQPELADYLLGSVAGKVVRHAECTVMVVR